MPKNLKISLLFDFYGGLLTDKQRKSIEYYYNHDLSLAEIAEHAEITRQGVRDSIKRAEAQLFEYEETLGLYRKFQEKQTLIEKLTHSANTIEKENQKVGHSKLVQAEVENIIDIAKQLNN